MTAQRRPLVAANWKMNGSLASNADWTAAFVARAASLHCDVVVCAPFPYLCTLGRSVAPAELGAQDLSERTAGAFTGDVAGEMLADVGCRWVIVGHSERRQLHGETDAVVAAKAARALQAGLRPIVCVGETLAEREAGRTQEVVRTQLAAVLGAIGEAALARGALAYEPVWAIGTGRNATPRQAQEVHAALRAQVVERDRASAAALRILYGGSVKPANAAELFSQPDIDGGLIGGASLSAADFLAICMAVGT
ncbi:MAG: triose-phosphate isomerase [Burkholderiaceae bacterium]|jgi:triosephosphate isomerase|nr:triose-phosphate isomerase [Burkholderiaceae bacterium]